MNPYMGLFSVWGLVTLVFVALLVYRARMTSHDRDWIPLTNDAVEDRAIKAQAATEAKAEKLTWPIRSLFVLSILLLLVILGLWIYQGIMMQPGS